MATSCGMRFGSMKRHSGRIVCRPLRSGRRWSRALRTSMGRGSPRGASSHCARCCFALPGGTGTGSLPTSPTAEVSAFVDGMNVGLRTRLGYLTDIRTLFSWGIQKGLAGSNPIVAAMPGRATRRKIMLAKRERRKEQVLGVEDCRALLGWTRAHDPGLLVYPVLCLPAPVHRQLPRTGLISRIVLNRGWSILPPLLMGYQLSKCPCTKFQMLVRRVPVKRSNLSLRSGDLFQCNQPFYDRLNIIGYGYLAQ